MDNTFEIVWSKLAEDMYIEILKDLLNNYPSDVALSFDEKTEKLISRLRTFNKLCPSSVFNPLLRKCVVTKQTSMIYRTSGNVVEIVAFIDNRSNHGF